MAYQYSPSCSSGAYSQDGKSIQIPPWCSHSRAHNRHCSRCIHLYLRGKGKTSTSAAFCAPPPRVLSAAVFRSTCHVCRLTSAVGQSVQGVAFVAETLKTTRGVHTCVIACPLEKTLVYICNQNRADDMKAGQSAVMFTRRDFPTAAHTLLKCDTHCA